MLRARKKSNYINKSRLYKFQTIWRSNNIDISIISICFAIAVLPLLFCKLYTIYELNPSMQNEWDRTKSRIIINNYPTHKINVRIHANIVYQYTMYTACTYKTRYHHCTYTALLEKTNVRGVPLIGRFLLRLTCEGYG